MEELQRGIRDLTSKLEDLNERSKDGAGKLPLLDSQLTEYFRMYVPSTLSLIPIFLFYYNDNLFS